MDLKSHLNQGYRDLVMSGDNRHSVFIDALKADPELRKSAEAKQAELTHFFRVGRQDFVSRTHLSVLETALKAADMAAEPAEVTTG